MESIIGWIAIILVLAGLGAAGWFLLPRLLGTESAGGTLFGGGRERRLGVSETLNIDGRRKLLLVQRDGVEHLIMTGGPVDVVIEQGIRSQGSEPDLVGTRGLSGEPVAAPSFGRARARMGAAPQLES